MLPEGLALLQALGLQTCACLTDDRELMSRWRKLGGAGEYNIDGSSFNTIEHLAPTQK